MTSLRLPNPTQIDQILEHASFFAATSMAENTRRAYDLGWKIFIEWCLGQKVDPWKENNREALVAFFLSDKAMQGDLKLSSIIVYLSGVKWVYAQNGVFIDEKSDVLSKVIRGIKRFLGCRPLRKEPIFTERLRAMVESIDTSKSIGIRDRALLVLGFAGAFRRSELVSLNIEDFSESDQGYLVLLKKSKTDQEKNGFVKTIPYGSYIETCPVRSIKSLINQLGRKTGPLFTQIKKGGFITDDRLSPAAVALVIKRNASINDRMMFSGHSLRSGFVTAAAKRDVPIHQIMLQTGHKKVESLFAYIREIQSLKNCAASKVGL